MIPTYDLPTERPDGRPRGPRRAAATFAALGILTISLAAAVPAAAAAAEPTPAPPISAPAGAHTLGQADVDAWLDGLLPAALETAGIAGGVVTVVDDGEIVTTRGYGYADTGTTGGEAVPVDAERTLFRPGSVSKLFTATAAMQLVESGDVDLDTDIAAYLDFDVPRSFDGPVTLRHLLTHTAGFEERLAGLIGAGDTSPVLRDELAEEPPEQVYEPGTVPAYSNYGNSLVGYIVERVSGVPFEEYVERDILTPAGMTSSTFAQPLPDALRDRISQGYATSADAPGPFEIVGTPPAGALTASAPDMARFMLAQLGEPGTGSILEPRTLDLMHAPALDESLLGNLAAASRMTLGFFDESRNGHRIIGHGGDTNYFHSHLQLYPEERTGVFVSLNSTGSSTLATLELRDAVLHGFTDRYFPADAAPVPSTVDEGTATEHAAIAEGSYVAARGMQSTFLASLEAFSATQITAREDGRLLITPGPLSDSPALYEEVEPWVWREVDGQRTITMRVAGDRVEAIGIEGAFTMLPAQPERTPGVALPVLGVSALILLVAAVAWPVGAIVRRVRHRSLPEGARGLSRILTKVAGVCAVLALGGWTATLLTVMGLEDVSEFSLRQLQVVQAIGVLGIVPAVLQVVGAVRHRHGWRRILGTVLVVLALAGIAWFAIEFRLLAPSVSY
ncbi:serine hydrolase domain-containing protein [Promicromonospora iranensis]|uniref:CubicO group peptidase (Beta-lactamase class C family) n=1 Tax=Promicromonospora iranensis TaxID=1105144 RepID=A0ABU2CJZ4_9MICO|nr:serine hydrolase domain-containing protein [Promicromonospora iranensis]MDR7381639.1 CubicO group peptidase (beta-lactamase class C family) [Promicromonospora iranensis]